MLNFKKLSILLMLPTLLAGCTGHKNDDKPTENKGGDTGTSFVLPEGAWDWSHGKVVEDKGGTYTFRVNPYGFRNDDISLTVSGPASQSTWLNSMLEDFNAHWVESGGKEIKFTTANHEEGTVAGEVSDWNKGPNVYAFASDQIMGLYQLGALDDIPTATVKSLKKSLIDAKNAEGKMENCLDVYGHFANHYNAYPYNSDNGYFLYYDKSVLSADDVKTMEGILSKCSTDRKLAWNVTDAFYSVGTLFSEGARYTYKIDANGIMSHVAADFDKKGLRPLRAMVDVVSQKDKVQTSQIAPTKENKVCAVVDGSWNASGYATALGENYGCAKLPTVNVKLEGEEKGKDMQLWSFLGFKCLGVNPLASQGKQKQLALSHEVATFLSSGYAQEKRFDTFSVEPSNKAILALDKVQKDPHIAAVNEQSQFAIAQTAVPAGTWVAPKTMMEEIVNDYVDKGKTDELTDKFLQKKLDDMNEAYVKSK